MTRQQVLYNLFDVQECASSASKLYFWKNIFGSFYITFKYKKEGPQLRYINEDYGFMLPQNVATMKKIVSCQNLKFLCIISIQRKFRTKTIMPV